MLVSPYERREDHTKGEKYTEMTKKWRDRGGGKGYGFVTTRKVQVQGGG